ncbi:MAG: NAD-dependent epimerase/dehydratase family protein, partial [Candidatus Caldatribacteriota bacterium]
MSSNEIVIITGSSGYIGSALTKKLSANFKIIGLDRDIPDKRVEGVDYYALDFSSSDELYEVIKGLRQKFGASIKSVVHLVAYYSFSGEESDLYQKITVEGSGNLLRILNEFFQVEQFIFSSTMLVHRPAPSGKEIDEESPVSPSWPYPESKVKAEKIIAKEKGNAKVVNLRIAGIYYDLLKIKTPKVVDGVKQDPLDGISMTYTFKSPDAPEKKKHQYFEMAGS